MNALIVLVMFIGGCATGVPSWEGGDTVGHAPKATACICQCGTNEKAK